jgi:tetratricopeptide (TPR) repeat protein
MALFFKSGDELFDESIELIKRKDYNKAVSALQKCIDKGSEDAPLAKAYLAIIYMIRDPQDVGTYERVIETMSSCGTDTLEFGLTHIECQKFIVECELVVRYTNLLKVNGNAEVREKKGNDLIRLGQEFQIKIGRDNLKTQELITGDIATSGLKQSLSIQALGYETLASSSVLKDPKKAAEYLQNAVNLRRQAGESGDEDLQLMKSYSKSAKCWVCGRSATGEGIHFVSMSSEITPMMKEEDGGIVRSSSEDAQTIYVCRPCFSAISRRADAISAKYYEDAMRELRETEIRLTAMIAEVRMYASFDR